MATKPAARQWAILEQIVEDPVSGLVLQFEVTLRGEFKLRVVGDLPFGNRDFVFGKDGQLAGTGTAVAEVCRPSWLREV